MKLSPNEVREELRRVEQGNYKQFLKKIQINRLRGLRNQSIEFKYPVTALIAPNGGGKSTILGAAALAYKSVKPAKFFPKAFIGDEAMADWSVEYTMIDKPTRPADLVSRSARFAQSKWRRNDLIDRNTEYVEIQRTVPAGELTAFRRFIGVSEQEREIKELKSETLQYAGAVLDKTIDDYRKVRFYGDQSYSLLVRQSESDGYSQFHFGAGEASIISTIERVETAPDSSLVLIEEAENGLHPVATRQFVNYLQNVAKRKRLQVIFTTHSQDAIDTLPPQAIWSVINGNLINGQLSIESLRAVSGHIPEKRVVFVEDAFVSDWVQNAIKYYGRDFAPETRVFAAGGYPNVVKVTQFHNSNPAAHTNAVAIVDGDIYDPITNEELPDFACFLGDKIPESTVFDYIYENRVTLVSKIRQRCLITNYDPDHILAAFESTKNSACDPHQLYDTLSEKLDFASAISIRNGMVDLFNEENPGFWKEAIDFIREKTSS